MVIAADPVRAKPTTVTAAMPFALPVVIAIEQDDREALSQMAHEISRELESNAILIAWHDTGRDPLYLLSLADTDGEEGVRHAMVEMGASAGRLRNPSPRSQWRLLDGLMPSGLLTTSIPIDHGVVTVTTWFRRVRETTRMHAGEAAARLLPLIQPFFRIWTAHLRSGDRLRDLTAAINRSDVGLLLVDAQAHITFANDVAESFIAHEDGLRRHGNMLVATRFSETLRLHAAIDHVLASKRADGVGPIMALARKPGRPLLISILPAVANAREGVAIVHIFDPERDLRGLIEPVCRHYGLTSVETRLACRIADGTSLADAATALRVREMTARSYLKHIFLKTGTKRQGELTAMLLKSAVRANPGPGGFAF